MLLGISVLVFIFLAISLLIDNVEARKEKKILMIIAPQNFRDEELLIPKALLEKEGYKVVIASNSLSPARGMLGAVVKPDLLLSQVKVEEYEAIVFVGGIGSQHYFHDQTAHKIAKEAIAKDKILAAICLAPRILAEAGVLKEKKATVWQTEAKALETKGARYTGKPVEIDGKIITGAGPQAAEEFAKSIIKLLKTKR